MTRRRLLQSATALLGATLLPLGALFRAPGRVEVESELAEREVTSREYAAGTGFEPFWIRGRGKLRVVLPSGGQIEVIQVTT